MDHRSNIRGVQRLRARFIILEVGSGTPLHRLHQTWPTFETFVSKFKRQIPDFSWICNTFDMTMSGPVQADSRNWAACEQANEPTVHLQHAAHSGLLALAEDGTC